jgi:dolichol-phosphate mannosyltransferase
MAPEAEQRRGISVVVPVYRTGAFLEELHRRLRATLDPTGRPVQVVLVDDGSPDDAWSKICELSANDQRVLGVKLSRNFGQHPAIAAGLAHADQELTVLMDGDLQDPPEAIPELVQRVESGCDVAFTVTESTATRSRLTSMSFNYVFSRVASVDVPPGLGTMRAFNRRFREAVLAFPERGVLYSALMLYVGFTTTFVSIPRAEREDGGTGYNFWARLSLAVNTLVSYTNVPHRLLVGFGCSVTIASFIYLVVLVIQYAIAGRQLASGVALLLGITILLMGTIIVSIGIVGTYVFRVFQEVLGRPRYLVQERVGGN